MISVVLQSVLIFLLIALPVGCWTNWQAGFKRLAQGLPLLEYRKREPACWGLLDVGLIFVAILVIVSAATGYVSSLKGIEDASELTAMNPQEQSAIILAFGLSTLLATALSVGWLWARFQRLDGFEMEHFWQDVELGFRWFFMLVVPILLLQLLLTRWFPTNHPIVDMLRDSGDLSFLPIAAFAAVVAAPIFEEFLFRLLLQGWLEKLHAYRGKVNTGTHTDEDRTQLLVGGTATTSPVFGNSVGKSTSQSVHGARYEKSNPYSSSMGDAAGNVPVDSNRPEPDSGSIVWWPIVLTSLLFGLAHLGHGPDWVPLFFLALGLGYLYQRTGRVLPSIVVHVLVNTLGILQLWAAVMQEG